ncbi:hypothetical protein EXN66_Car021475 [Channa argus]|uniref:Uncharacterized protein n=1 Tax=Channa argus TaxID=215402 RepID=A0A6G1QTG3_CHAAH|nr:hypothetical protein EXN66_Car021475 [Channa argus]
MPLLQDFKHCRRSLSQSFPSKDDSQNKARLKDITVAKGFLPRPFLFLQRKIGEGENSLGSA